MLGSIFQKENALDSVELRIFSTGWQCRQHGRLQVKRVNQHNSMHFLLARKKNIAAKQLIWIEGKNQIWSIYFGGCLCLIFCECSVTEHIVLYILLLLLLIMMMMITSTTKTRNMYYFRLRHCYLSDTTFEKGKQSYFDE